MRSVSSNKMGSGCYSLHFSVRMRAGATGRKYVKSDMGYFMKICLGKFGSYRTLYMMAKLRFIVAGHINPFVTNGTYLPPYHYFFSPLVTSRSHFSMLPSTMNFLYSVKTHCPSAMLSVSQSFRPSSCIYYSCYIEWCLHNIRVWENLRASFEFYSEK